ncbi:efflux RND transporter periplasmic adaptor subunit [Pseudidiomarina taiwanensis]|nr:efflux RND transporter periplasmic adaptor subunit [Pseudidiomarina taiwanensis]
MFKRIFICVFSAILLITMPLSSVQAQSHADHIMAADQHDHSEHSDKHTLYVCPMHAEVQSHEPGSCPICKMDLVAVEQPKQLYVCPMHPEVTSHEPGSCPICKMDLVPVEPAKEDRQAHQQPSSPTAVRVSPEIIEQFAVQTATVQRTRLEPVIDTFGRLEFNTDQRVHVHARAAGWIERLAVRSEGVQVNKGDLLYEIYSKEIVVAQQDYLQLLNSPNRTEQLLRDGRIRLELLGFTQAQIRQLEQRQEIFYRLPVYAPQTGVVTNLAVADGKYVSPADELLTLISTASWWVLADVPERYSQMLADHAAIELSAPQLGLEQWRGQVDYIYPQLAQATATQQVRIAVPQTAFQGRPQQGLQIGVKLLGETIENALTVPLSSLILAANESRVAVEVGPGEYQLKAVQVGSIVADQAQITAGLEEGEKVVVAGQFMLDAEAQLRASYSSPQPQVAETGHDHSQH